MTTQTKATEPSVPTNPAAQPPDLVEPSHATLIALYSENGAIARAMMEWRHRVITLYVLTLGGVGSTVLWLHQNKALRNVPIPFFLASIVAYVLGLMDHTNARILGFCYLVGGSIEHVLFGAKGTIYAALLARRKSKRTVTYTRLLRVLYFGTGTVFLGVAVYLCWRPLS